jgi:hypothetical protein
MSYYSGTEIFVGCFTLLMLCILLGALGGWVFMLLWNWLMPLFWANAPVLTFWQAWGVCILLSWIGSFFRNKSK